MPNHKRNLNTSNRPLLKNGSNLLFGLNLSSEEVEQKARSLDTTPTADGDPLLAFYQSLVPPHIKVFKRDHPQRHPGESDEEYEFRWQFYEYAKLHPLTPPSYFYDFEVEDKLLVPIEDSSGRFTIEQDEYKNSHRYQNGGQRSATRDSVAHEAVGKGINSLESDEDIYWGIQSDSNIPPASAPEQLRTLSGNRIKLHQTTSDHDLHYQTRYPELLIPELLEKDISESNIIHIEISQTEIVPLTSSKPVNFGTQPKYHHHHHHHHHNHQRVPFKENTRVASPTPKIPCASNITSKSNKFKSPFLKNFKTFEELFHRPSSIPSTTWYISNELRKQLAKRYTFSRGNSLKHTSLPGEPSRYFHQKWVDHRLHRGQPTAMSSAIKINKTVSKSVYTLLFPR